jgi:hypothetical protein
LLLQRNMTLTKFLVLGSAVAGVVILSNKNRRDRLLRSAKDFIDDARRKLEMRNQPVDVGTGTGDKPVTTAPDYPTPT